MITMLRNLRIDSRIGVLQDDIGNGVLVLLIHLRNDKRQFPPQSKRCVKGNGEGLTRSLAPFAPCASTSVHRCIEVISVFPAHFARNVVAIPAKRVQNQPRLRGTSRQYEDVL